MPDAATVTINADGLYSLNDTNETFGSVAVNSACRGGVTGSEQTASPNEDAFDGLPLHFCTLDRRRQ